MTLIDTVRERVLSPVIVPEQHLQQCKVCSENGKSCGPAGEPDGAGLQDADFVLYVSVLTTERCGQENIVAYAAYCQVEASLDSLGLYQWSDQVVRRASRLWDIRGNRMVRHEVILLITPRVVNEAMTGSHTQNRVFSTITLATMEDTGKQKAAPFCDALRSNPLQLTCRQGQMAVAVCNLQKYMNNIPAEYQYFDGIPGIPFQDFPYYGGSVEIADYCPFNQEFSWHLSGEF